jgi:hypothetical protein
MKTILFTPGANSIICGALLLSGSLLACFGADGPPTIVKIGSSRVRLVPPEGYIDCSGENDPVRNFAENFCPPANRLLGVFGSEEFRRSALAGEAPPMFDYALVEVSRGLIWRDATTADFAEASNSLKREQKTLFCRAEPELKAAINRLNRSLQEATGENVSLNLGQPVSLGVFDESSRHISILMLMRMQLNSRGKSDSSKVAATISLIHVNGKVIFAYAYRAYTGEPSVTKLKAFTTDWITKLAKANE